MPAITQPKNLTSYYVDFASPGNQTLPNPFIVTATTTTAFSNIGIVNTGNNQRTIGFIGTTSNSSAAINYYLKIIAGNTLAGQGQLIDVNSNSIATGNTKYYSSLPPGTPATASIIRKVANVGHYQETANLFQGFQNGPASGLQSTGTWDYVILQKAVPVTQRLDPTATTLIGVLGNNTSINATNGEIFCLNKSLSRGKELSSAWIVLKYDPNAGTTPVTAIPGVDYTLSSGTLTSDTIKIAFINSSFNFIVQNTCSGYTFQNNPYYVPVGTTGSNDGLAQYSFILNVPNVTFNVLFPQLDVSMSVPSDSELGTDPLKTYQGQAIQVQAIVLGSTGSWIKKTPNAPDTTIVKTDDDWMAEMTNRCTVTLQVSEKTTGNIILTRDGFGPYNISLQTIELYTLKYVTALK